MTYERRLAGLFVQAVPKREAADVCRKRRYLHRRPSMSFAFGIFDAPILGRLLGVVTFGVPPSRHLMRSACASDPDVVMELNRLWIDDELGRNAESWFVSKALDQLPPHIVVSYADTAVGHNGTIYRAANFRYAGITDMDRTTPRFDYVTPGKHSRDTTRNGTMHTAVRVRRKPKHRYWTVTGSRRDKRRLLQLVTWPDMPWGEWDCVVADTKLFDLS